MSEAKINIDMGASLELDGIFQYVYFGDSTEPAIQETVTWTDLVSDAYETQCIPAGPLVYDTDNDGVLELIMLADELRNAADVLELRVRESKIFLRDKWTAASQGLDDPRPRDDFVVNYEGYLEHIINGDLDDEV